MIPLAYEENKYYEKQKVCCICKKEFSTDDDDDDDNDDNKKYHTVRDHYHYTGKYGGFAHDICNPTYKTLKEIPIAFHNGSTYEYHFIIKKLAKEFKGKFECLGENTEKYINFSVPVEEKFPKDKIIIHKLKFIDSFRFMSSNYQTLLIIYLKFTAKSDEHVKKEKVCDFIGLKNNKLHHKGNKCRKRWLTPLGGLTKKFPNT